MRHTRATLCCLAAIGLSCSSAPSLERFDTEGWLELEGPGFFVIGNAPESDLRTLAHELAVFDALVTRVTNVHRGASSVPLRIYVFEDETQAELLLPSYVAGQMVPSLSGYYTLQSIRDGDYVFTREVLFHEYTHYVLRKGRRQPYPRWYDEGFALFLSSVRWREDTIIVGASPRGRLEAATNWGLMPLERLFEGRMTRRDAGRFYPTSWVFVHFMNGSKQGRAGMHDFVNRLSVGEKWEPAFDSAFGAEVEELEPVLEKYVEKLVRGVRVDHHLSLDSLEREISWRVRVVSAAEISYQLGMVARIRGEQIERSEDMQLARALFGRTLEHDPSHARARAALAWSEGFEGRWEEAARQIERASREAPEDAVVAMEAGRVKDMRARDVGSEGRFAREARAEFERAVKLDAELPSAHAELARSYAGSGAVDRAVATFERARALGAWDPRLDLDLAKSYLRAGSPDRARPLLQLVAAFHYDAELSEEASRLLEDLPQGRSTSKD